MEEYSALDYIKIDIANQYGWDKKSFKQRIAWVNSIKDLRSKTDKAEKPAQYLAAVLALEDALAGKPTGHLVGLDACSSGITILGILIGCHETSRNTGVIGNKRMDMYEECTKAINTLLPADINIPRADVKQSQMTHYYGSKAKPKEIFGEDTDELAAFYQAQEMVAPGACVIMQELLSCWQPYALNHSHTLPDGFVSKVPVLQKFKAKIEIDELDHASLSYIYEDNVGTEKGLAVAANMTHAIDGFLVRETVRRCNYDNAKLEEVLIILDAYADDEQNGVTNATEVIARNHQFVSLRGIETINTDNVLEFSRSYRNDLVYLIETVLDNPSFPVLTIHDEFKSHPNYMNYLRSTYQGILAELADSTVGQQVIREVCDDDSYVLEKFSTDLGNEIIESEYFLS
jgi:hypothetical protein